MIDISVMPTMTLTREIKISEWEAEFDEPGPAKVFTQGSTVVALAKINEMYVIYSPELRDATTVHEMFLREVPADRT